MELLPTQNSGATIPAPELTNSSFLHEPPVGLTWHVWTSVKSPSIEPTMYGIRNEENLLYVFLSKTWYFDPRRGQELWV